MSKPKSFDNLESLYSITPANLVTSSTGDADAIRNAERNKFIYQQDKQNNQSVITKRFNKNSYNGPTARDFKERLKILYETAITELKLRDLSEGEYQRQKEKLDRSRMQALQAIESNCQIKPAQLDELLAQEKETRRIIKQATLYIQQFVFDAIAVISPDALQNVKSLDKALKDFAAAESKLTAEKGRSNFINFYPNPKDKVMRISMQRVIGDAIPSTERLGEPAGKLPNFVECGIGYEEDGQFHSQFSGYRHSSYPPIKVKNDFERHQKTAIIVKDMLAELANKAMMQGNTTEPITLSLSSLTLLTPLAIQLHKRITDEAWMPEGESEYKQLQESYNALMMYNQRETTVEVNGHPVKVQLNVNIVNAPSNPLGVKSAKQGSTFGKIARSKLEMQINAQGMNRYMNDIERYLTGKNYSLPYKNPITEAQENKLKELETRLIKLNEKLETSLTADDKDMYNLNLLRIKKAQFEVFAIEDQIMAERKALFNQNRDEVEKFLSSLKTKDSRTNEDDVAELYYQSLAMFIDGTIEPGYFGVRFLLANEKIGRIVDFYCKSGEDRTGRMQNLLEELCEFQREYGRFPGYDLKHKKLSPDDLKQQQAIARYVSEFSVSRDINDENVHGARGLQIADSLALNESLPNNSGNDLGKTAKAVISLRDLTVQETIKKKFSPMDKDRERALQHTLQTSRANVLLAPGRYGFENKIIRAKDRAKYEQEKTQLGLSEPPRAIITATKETMPAYSAQYLHQGDMVIMTKKYEVDESISPDKFVVACIEQDTQSIRDVTTVPKGKSLPIEYDEEIAFQQAFAKLRPPFNAEKMTIILDGADNKQVARIHAALLVLKDSHPSLKSLEIYVSGDSPSPQREKSASKQKEANQKFIAAHLSPHWTTATSLKQELSELITKQSHMKSVVKATRSEHELNMVEGARITPFIKK